MNRKVTGIGCFAKSATLSRVFKKMVRNYTLGQFENINLANSQDMVTGQTIAIQHLPHLFSLNSCISSLNYDRYSR